MSVHRYAARAIRGDLLRAIVGFMLTAVPCAATSESPVAAGIFGLLATLFFVFGVRSYIRRFALVLVTEDGVISCPLGERSPQIPGFRHASLAWRDIQAMRVRFFSTKRDRSEGWMELRLADGKDRLMIDSTIEGFEAVVARAALAAERGGVALDDATLANLGSLRIGAGAARI